MYEAYGTRYINARDTCWLVQTDPAYARQLLSIGETSGLHKNGCCSSKKINLTGLLLDVVERQQIWGELTDEAKYALDVFNQRCDGSSPANQSQDEYKKALNFLESRLRAEFVKFASKFRDLAITLGTFDEHFSFEICHQALVKSSRAAQEKDVVFWCASRLHDHATQDVDYPGKKLQTIERYSYHPTSKERGRLHQLLLECVSDMRTVDNAMMALLCHRPRSAGALNTDDIEALIPSIEERAHWITSPFATLVDQKWSKHVDRLWPPLKALLDLPSMSGLITRKALNTFDKNHQGLHDFWEQARLVRYDLLVELKCPEEFHVEIMEPVAMGITPEYLESRDEERRLLLKEIEAKGKSMPCSSRLLRLLTSFPRSCCRCTWCSHTRSQDANHTPSTQLSCPDQMGDRVIFETASHHAEDQDQDSAR